MGKLFDNAFIGIVCFVVAYVIGFVVCIIWGAIVYTQGTSALFLCEGVYPWGTCGSNSYNINGQANNCAYILIANPNCSFVNQPLTPAKLYSKEPQETWCFPQISNAGLSCKNVSAEAYDNQFKGAMLISGPFIVTVGFALLIGAGFGIWLFLK